MKMRILMTAILAGALALTAEAWGAPNVVLVNKAEVNVTVVNDKGEKETRRVQAAEAEVIPGTVVIYRIDFHNYGDSPTDPGFVIRNAVPEEVSYLEGTAAGKGAEITFSVDGGKSFDVPSKLFIIETDGTRRSAHASDYTHIMWKFKKPLGPGEDGSVGFQAKVK